MSSIHRLVLVHMITLGTVLASDGSDMSWFEKLLTFLVSGALVFSLIKGYLTVNKIWKRRKNEEVSNSISIVAAMLGFVVGFPFLLNALIITQDYFNAAKSVIALFLATVFTLIGTGYFVDKNRGVGFFKLLGQALKLEGKESGDLISDMIRPKGARKIIDILQKLAAIDDDIAKEEIELIEQFSEKWGIDVPDLTPGKPQEITNLVELKGLVQSYLDESPDNFHNKNKILNIVISKSGNTLETISNANIIIKKDDKNIFITEKKNSYLINLAKKLKSEIVEHKNFIGGRYSVLSEVGMLPAELMGLNEKKFKQFNNLVKSKRFVNSLVMNVSSTLELLKKGRFNSVILNYDESSNNFFKWYQQLIAESLGKNSKGILPVISSMPKDNHSLMQLYLDGPNKNFFTFFYAFTNKSIKIKNNSILPSHNYLKNKTIGKIMYSQKKATQIIFEKKNIPFRSFEIFNRNEQTMGELFCFFILETILLGRSLNINPFNQPSVELIKKETKKILI